MKRILLLTVAILAACLFGGASAGDLDGRYADLARPGSRPNGHAPGSLISDVVDHLLQHEFAGSGLVARRIEVFQSVSL